MSEKREYVVWYMDGVVELVKAQDVVDAIRLAWTLRPHAWQVHSVYLLSLYTRRTIT
jgi:hypothetical protein